MNRKDYRESLSKYNNEQLKDIIAGRFEQSDDERILAAIALLQERQRKLEVNKVVNGLSLNEIPDASLPVLLEIIKNPDVWGKDAVGLAEEEVLRRENDTPPTQGTSTFTKIFMTIFGVIASIVILKGIAILALILFFFYSVLTCLSNV